MSTTDDDRFVAYGGGNYDYLAIGPCNFGFVTIADGKNPNFNTGVSGGGNVFGVFGYAGPGEGDDNNSTSGPARNDYTNSVGVMGTSHQVTGVAGTTDGLYPGVYGQCGDPGDPPLHLQAGVLGVSKSFPGVLGRSLDGVGVNGQSMTDYGVWGTSIRNTGVVGQTGGGFGPPFTNPNNPGKGDVRSTPVGVLGTTRDSFGVAGTSFKSSGMIGQSGGAPAFDPSINHTAGVVGTSRDVSGVAAVSQKSFGVLAISGAPAPALPGPFAGRVSGVLGSSQDSDGVIGSSRTLAGVLGVSVDNPGIQGFSAKHVGVYGEAANNYAGFFVGNVFVTGTLTATVKNAVVPFPDGSQRLLHCMESPEHWFEDFGSARLKAGRAAVELDADFAKVVKLTDYRVFLTPEGDCNGLYVRSKAAKGFEVRELQGGTSDVRFSYRIVGKRKDITAHKRFARIGKMPAMPRPKRRPARGRKSARAAS